MELPEKIELALVTYLQAQVQAAPSPSYFDPATQIHAGESDEDITGQVIRCICPDADQEAPLYTGNFWFPIRIELITPVAIQTDAQVASPDVAESTSQRDKHRALAAILESAIMIDSLPAELNLVALALGAGYECTVIGILDRRPMREQTPLGYMSGFTFRLYAGGRIL